MDRVVYLIGSGATMAEMRHQGIETHLSMTEIEEAVYQMSKDAHGKYGRLHDDLSLPSGIDIEVMISLLEGCTSSESGSFREVCDELRKFFRSYLVSQIMEKPVEPKISECLLHIHRNYGVHMGRTGEELIGILTTNYDSLLEEAFCCVYGGVNCGYPFYSKTYRSDHHLPKLLKLHGSFNWKIHKGDFFRKNRLEVSKEFEAEEYSEDYSGWIPPSVYKRPGGVIESMWNNAVSLLTMCNTLRVIGSSLRNEDSALLSLIFTSSLRNRQVNGKGFSIELIVPDIDAVGSEERPTGIMQRLRFLGGMVNFSQLGVYPDGFISAGNIYKEWLHMQITQIEKNRNATVSDDDFLADRLWQEVPIEVRS